MVEPGAPAPAILDSLQRSLAHRGPDGHGRYIGPRTGLVQTRLAIIDLKTGDQPLFGARGTVLVANGEIYNYQELRAGFGPENFRTASDCELPLATHARDGANYAESLRGMYAIALYDQQREELFLSRDPFGIKPLYYAELAGGVVFASEAGALRRTGLVGQGIRSGKAIELLQLQFTTGRETIFDGIHRVLPGETITLRQGRIASRHVRAALPDAPPRPLDEDTALRRLDETLMDSVAVHQRSDVPYGLFLSGGIDSAAILACMARLNAAPVHAFTAAFPGTAAHDEREYARAAAKAVNARHVEIEVTASQFWNCLPAIAAALDDPVADYAIIPTWILAAKAAKELKVVLTGEGGDEIFAGYGRYRTALRPRLLGGRTMRRRGFLDGLGVLRESRHWRDGIAAAERQASAGHLDRLQSAQASDCAEWLPNDLLLKLDRCLMAHGLEGRTPMLDPVAGAFGFGLPDRLKISQRTGKFLLRRWLSQNFPAAQAFATKRGFTVPVAEWIYPRARELAERLEVNDGVAEICRPSAVGALFNRFADRGGKREGAACWLLLFYALWHRMHVEGARPGMDVFETLRAGPARRRVTAA